MKLIIETDLGHDPDDFFAITYLAAAGVDIGAILIVPGDPDQIAVAKFICAELGLNIPIGASKLNRTKLSSGGVHYSLLEKYKYPKSAVPDGLGYDILKSICNKDCEFFIIGPATSTGKYLSESAETYPKITMQGGFLGYDLYQPLVKIEDFENKFWMPTFNLNGDRNGGLAVLGTSVRRRQMVGKNVCHTILLDNSIKFQDHKEPAKRLFKEAADLYLEKHNYKKFHDPTAAVCHLHPEIGTWFKGRTIKMETGWGTVSDPDGDYILADIDRVKLWDNLINFK